jgi:hypothetical protein
MSISKFISKLIRLIYACIKLHNMNWFYALVYEWQWSTLFDLPVFCSVVSVYLTCSISNGLLANLDLWNLKINIKYISWGEETAVLVWSHSCLVPFIHPLSIQFTDISLSDGLLFLYVPFMLLCFLSWTDYFL